VDLFRSGRVQRRGFGEKAGNFVIAEPPFASLEGLC
jgi:hypothetical protein